MLFCVVKVEYGVASDVEWCVDSIPINGRDGCVSDEKCLNNVRTMCDANPNCFGIAWYTKLVSQKLKQCTSTKMGPQTAGWRTMMKLGIFIVTFL